MRTLLLFPGLLLTGLLLTTPVFAQGGRAVERGSPLQVVEPDAGERELRMTPVVRAVQKAADSVVSIYLQHQLARVGAVTEGQGSGVILDASGLVITNWHVVAPVLLADPRNGPLGVEVKLRDGRSRAAQVLSSSPQRDLALLQLRLEANEQVKPIEIGRSADLMIGETVIAIGNPQGHANTVTSGVLSAIDRSIKVRTPDGSVREYAGLLQTDAAINQGNSGGALLDITGRLIGINNAMAMGAENIGFAIPMDAVREEFDRELIQSASFVGPVDGPWLGLEVADAAGGVVVREVVPGSPAAAADIRPGDVLARIGEHDVRTSLDYLRRFATLRSRQPVPLSLRREGKGQQVDATPIPRFEGTVLQAIGAELEQVEADNDHELAKRATLAFYRGSNLRRVTLLPAVLRVRGVTSGGPAQAFGLEPGDVLLSAVVDVRGFAREAQLTSLRGLAALLDQYRGGSLRLAFLRGDKEYEGTIDVRGPGRR